MAKRKVRPHPGVLKQLLKERIMTQEEAAKACGIDRKTLTKINRGEEVKLETLQKVANKLKVPITYFDPPTGSVGQVEEYWIDEAHGWLGLLLHKVDVDNLSEMLCAIDSGERIEWKLNVRTVDDEAISLLEQFEDAVKDLCEHVNKFGVGLSLRRELDELKKNKRVVSLMVELARHSLAVLGAEYVSWQCEEALDEERGLLFVDYKSTSHVMLSIEGHPAHERRQKVWQGEKVPPRFAPPPERSHTVVMVDGRQLNEAPNDFLSSDASSEDSDAK